ncbi:MAG: UDP-3-O-(3-hydroxymyristoyl)glucosamine N-acyltransferase [Bacteroidia bacterium]|nr:UDP-3-O-(3-hydroxymyristoyl)glucosamine N-acyltransferase [Bacteroidia bacterium]
MKFSIRQIAHLIGAEITGDPEKEIHTFSSIEEGKEGGITFLANPKYEDFVYTTQASAIIVSRQFELREAITPTLLHVEDPYSAVAVLLEKAESLTRPAKKGIESPVYIAETASIGADTYIGAFAYVGQNTSLGNRVQVYPNVYIGEGVSIGEGSIIYPHVTIYYGSVIGKNCIIHAGSCIGSDGFGFAPQKDGTYKKIPQMGKVILEDNVEIGANTCIDRATFGNTIVKKGAKLDNLVQLAHNVEVGENTVIAAQTGVAGSTRIGKACMLGGQVGVVGHLKIADRTLIDAQSGVNRSIPESGLAFRGSPIQLHRQQLKSEVLFRKLEEMYRRIAELEKILANRE